MVIQTTLYDLIAALSAEVHSDDDDAVLTAVVVHLLQTHRVIYTGTRARYRLVCKGAVRPPQSEPRPPVQSSGGERRFL